MKSIARKTKHSESRETPPGWAITLDELAVHEAGHAAMHWILHKEATRTWINPRAVDLFAPAGMSEGTGNMVKRWDSLLVSLAGIAAETGYGLSQPLWDSTSPDFPDLVEARRVILEIQQAGLPFFVMNGSLINCKTVDDCLDVAFREACEILSVNAGMVEDLQYALLEKEVLTAREVEKICRRHPDCFQQLHSARARAYKRAVGEHQ